MEKEYRIEGKTLHFHMPKEVDHHVAKTLCSELDIMIENYGIKELIFDFSKTEFMDSSGIGVLIGRSKTMRFHQGQAYACGMGIRIKRIFEAAGLGKVIIVKEGEGWN